MKQQDLPQNKPESGGRKRPYQPPKAVVVPVKAKEQLRACNFNSFRVCGPNQ